MKPLRTPLVEVSEKLPFPSTFPALLDACRQAAFAGFDTAAEFSLRVSLSATNEICHNAVIALLRDMSMDTVAAQYASLAAAGAADGFTCAYDLAVALDTRGREVDAVIVLVALGTVPGLGMMSAVGLAVVALRRGLTEEASALIAPYLELAERHPRVCSVAGICALETRGQTAQAHLAAAARIARRDPVFREELKIAQRALLLMHLH